MSPTPPTSHETDVAEAWLTVLDYVSRVAQAVEAGNWFDLVEKGFALERAVRSLCNRVLDAEGEAGELDAGAVMAVVRECAGRCRASRALYPEGVCPHRTPLTALPPETGRLEEDE